MARPKGQPKLGGRKKGTPNKVTADVRERVIAVWDKLEQDDNGVQSLHEEAKKDPQWFYTNFIKPMVPKEVEATIETGDNFTEIIRKILK